jgi:hypothetical protein
MRLVLIVLATLWGAGAVLAFVQVKDKGLDARLTAGWLVLWPALLVLVYLNQPLPLWLALPVVAGFVPWFLAGPHLRMILKDPDRSKPGEIVGIPGAFWRWGGLAVVLLGVVFDVLVRP